MTVVVDASAVVQLLAGDPAVIRALRGNDDLHSVELMPFEVLNVLRRQELAGTLASAVAAELTEHLVTLPVRLVPAAPLLQEIWALRGSITAYDAAYVALARSMKCPLVTRDARLARASERLCEVLIPRL